MVKENGFIPIGAFIKMLRGKKIKAKYIADLVGVSPTYFSQIERGKEKLSIVTLEKIAIAFGYTLESFITKYLSQEGGYSEIFLKKYEPVLKDIFEFVLKKP